MGKLTEAEKALIKRTEKTLGIKLTQKQIQGILGRSNKNNNKVVNTKAIFPETYEAFEGRRKLKEDKQRQRQLNMKLIAREERKKSFYLDNLFTQAKRKPNEKVANNTKKIFNNVLNQLKKRHKRNKRRQEQEPKPISRLFGEFQEWEIDLVGERNSL